MKKLILWDIDGTLVLTGGAGMGALDRAFQAVHGRRPDLSKLELSGRTDQWIAAQVLEHNQLPVTPESIHTYLEAYLESLHAEVTARPGRVLPGILQLLELLHARPDVAQGLLTGNLHRGARIKLEHYRVWHYFAFGAFGDDSPARNDLGPHAVRRARERHAVEFAPANTFVIGDTPHDIECGRAIGAKTIGVATGQFSVAELQAHAPTAAFADFTDPAAFLRVIDGA
ncbi:MAG: haloacid dehalogenase-like hydrolase [Opitutae bacterium]|nr:haloacid dehalogenase-like hydrolase [Opitutae bacterium]